MPSPTRHLDRTPTADKELGMSRRSIIKRAKIRRGRNLTILSYLEKKLLADLVRTGVGIGKTTPPHVTHQSLILEFLDLATSLVGLVHASVSLRGVYKTYTEEHRHATNQYARLSSHQQQYTPLYNGLRFSN